MSGVVIVSREGRTWPRLTTAPTIMRRRLQCLLATVGDLITMWTVHQDELVRAAKSAHARRHKSTIAPLLPSCGAKRLSCVAYRARKLATLK
jgi:hypothetical protein